MAETEKPSRGTGKENVDMLIVGANELITLGDAGYAPRTGGKMQTSE